MRRYIIVLVMLLIVILVGMDVLLRLSVQQRTPVPVTNESRPTIIESIPTESTKGELSFSNEEKTIKLFESLSPSVVHITSITHQRDFFRMRMQERPQGTGSGFVWSSEGYIVTNFHVIKDASAAEVTLSDGSSWEAHLVGVEPDKDLAVLKIDAPPEQLPAIPVGQSENLKVGQSVLAIGNPFGFDQTLTTGVISGLGREIESVSRRPITGVIQTDAAINPGNSGGPLMDSSGRLIGINTAIFSPSGAYAGIGFAVPVDTVSRMVPQIIEFGEVRHVGLGIHTMEDHVARRMGINGLIVRYVIPDGPAEKAAIKAVKMDQRGRVSLGDVIIGINREEVRTSNDLYRILDGREVGEEVDVQLYRNGKPITVKVTLDVI